MNHLFIKDYKKRILFSLKESKIIALKHIIKNEKINFEKRYILSHKAQILNKNISATKIRNRCIITNRGRGNLKNFKLSRIKAREFLSLGLLPGYKKAVW